MIYCRLKLILDSIYQKETIAIILKVILLKDEKTLKSNSIYLVFILTLVIIQKYIVIRLVMNIVIIIITLAHQPHSHFSLFSL